MSASAKYLWLLLAAATFATAGCKPAAKDAAPAAAVQPAWTGVITGTIDFTGKAPAATIDTSMDPACAQDGVQPGKSTLPTEQFAVQQGKLANVFIYIKSGPAAAMTVSTATAQPVVMDQKNCRYVPHVVGVVAGGYVEFRNSDAARHNVHAMPVEAGNQTVDLSMAPNGSPQRRQFAKPELMIPVRCNNHPWMTAFINVSATPFFAVSDTQGHFEIHGLPPGDYVIGAVHEKMGEKTMKVTVPANQPATADFGFAL